MRAPAECKCGKIGRKGVLGAKPRNHIRPGAACRGPSVRNCPGGSGSPSSFALLHEIGSHLATALIPLTSGHIPVFSPTARARVGGERGSL